MATAMRRLVRTWTGIVCVVWSFSSTALGAGPSAATIVQQGNGRGAPACASCHGVQGQGMAAAGYPYLAGLPAAYLAKQLRDFAEGTRKNAIMQPFAQALSPAEIKGLAAYFSKLPSPEGGGAATQGANRDLGRALARRGKWTAGVPACLQCHGERGQGIAPHFPPLRGQPARYVEQQLKDWRSGARRNDPLGLMQSVSAALSDQEIAAVAAYLQSMRSASAAQPRETEQ